MICKEDYCRLDNYWMEGIIITAPGQHQVCQARSALLQKKKMKEEEGMRGYPFIFKIYFKILKKFEKGI